MNKMTKTKVLLLFLVGVLSSIALLSCQKGKNDVPQQLNTTVPTTSSTFKVIDVPPQKVESLLEHRLQNRYVPGEVIVKMKSLAGIQSVLPAPIMRQMGVETKGVITSGGEIIYKLPVATLKTLSQKESLDRTLKMVSDLKARPDIEYAQPNYIFQIVSTSPNDSGYTQQWHYFDNGSGVGMAPGGINLPTAWDTNKGSSSVVVAVIDTGILPNHEDIAGSPNVAQGYDFISDPDTANDGDGRDSDPTDTGDAIAAGECFPGSPPQSSSWHGTHVAGTIGIGKTNNSLGVAGVNWNVKVQAVRVLGKCGGTMVDINDAIRWAAGLPVPGAPNNATPAKVINMSLGGGSPCSMSPATQSAINDAVNAGATVVVAAGNEGQDASGFLPASCDNVITVAASDFLGRLATRYSNFGANVDIMAPGGDVRQDADNDGNPDGVLSMIQGGYAYYNGTSMAAPHVAGVAALLMAQDTSRTPSQIAALITSNAMPRTSTQCPNPCGAGLLNAATNAGPGPGPGPTPVSLTLSSSTIDLEISQSAQIVATLQRGTQPEVGKTITFQSSTPNIAAISPPTGITDALGQATATLNALAEGSSVVRVESMGQNQQATVTVRPVRTSALSMANVMSLAIVLIFILAVRSIKSRQS